MATIQINVNAYLRKNLKHPKDLDLTDEIISYIASLESKYERLKQEASSFAVEVSKMVDKTSVQYGKTFEEQLDNVQYFAWEQGYLFTHFDEATEKTKE